MRPDEILTQLLALNEGEQIVIPCNGLRHLERVRVALYRAKARIGHSMPNLAAQIKIKRNADKMELIIEQEVEVPSIIIRSPDGRERTVATDPDKERIITLMREDGATQEEIDEYLRERDNT